jgi:hypothetical protein
MFRIRNSGGVSMFLFGTTFLWLTPMYVAAATIVGFMVATWGAVPAYAMVGAARGPLRRRRAGLADAVLGCRRRPGVANPPFDVAIHAIGCAGVLLPLRLPRFEHSVHGHIVAGR